VIDQVGVDPFKRLRLFESADLVHEFYVGLHSRTPSAQLKRSIVSSFRQGRALFAAAGATESIARPITQFYAVSAISRGLALTLKPGNSESAMTPGHGLQISSFPNNLTDLTVTTCSGLLLDLTEALGCVVYRVNSSAPDWSLPLQSLPPGAALRLADVATLVPPLAGELRQWTSAAPIGRVELKSLDTSTDPNGGHRWSFSGQASEDELRSLFDGQDIAVSGMDVQTNGDLTPQLSQSYFFGNIGSVLLRPTLAPELRLGDLTVYFVLSYAFSMMARYRPSVWMSVWSGEGGDRIMPFADSFMSATQNWFPEITADHLQFIAECDYSMLPNTRKS